MTKKIYYETERQFLRRSRAEGRHLIQADFACLTDVEAACLEAIEKFGRIDLLYVDSPRNWWLDVVDVESLGRVAQKFDAPLCVDVTLDPVALRNQTSDYVVLSLSKYPSLGLTLGGAIVCRDAANRARVDQVVNSLLLSISAEAALIVEQQIVSLDDRMNSLQAKMQTVYTTLTNSNLVKGIRLPRDSQGHTVGGQLVVEVGGDEQGRRLEQIVGHHALDPRYTLRLACTFGSSITTVEHFASNPRHVEDEFDRGALSVHSIPATFVRVGLGCDPVDRICEDLLFAISASSAESLDV